MLRKREFWTPKMENIIELYNHVLQIYLYNTNRVLKKRQNQVHRKGDVSNGIMPHMGNKYLWRIEVPKPIITKK